MRFTEHLVAQRHKLGWPKHTHRLSHNHTQTCTRTWRTVGVKSVITYYRTQGQTWHIYSANYGSTTSTVTVTEKENEGGKERERLIKRLDC